MFAGPVSLMDYIAENKTGLFCGLLLVNFVALHLLPIFYKESTFVIMTLNTSVQRQCLRLRTRDPIKK